MNYITTSENNGSASPFDGIRRFDQHGNEYWMARELMKMLGYVKWDKFDVVIQTGVENLESAVTSTTDHVIPTGKLPTASDPVPSKDYKLSRLACYHITLACDSRGKPQVKAAKHYFATKTREAELAAPVPPVRTLPYHLEALEVARSVAEIADLLSDNPRLAQVLTDHAMNQVLEQKVLTATKEPELRGVVEIAAEMGFKTDDSSRVRLGMFVAKQGFTSKKEPRLCNGTKQLINCYPDTPELRELITKFFSN